eukprot:jgi/Botrbrau1/14664/Bobra.0108s0025.1
MEAGVSTSTFLFKGSSYTVANNCHCCGVAFTSGCWRRGWEADGGSVNLCNRCGLKYKKRTQNSADQASMDQGLDTPFPASGPIQGLQASGQRVRQRPQDLETPTEEKAPKRRTSKRQQSISLDDFMDDDDDSEAPSEQPVTPALPELPPVDPEMKPREYSQVDLSLTTYVMRRISCSSRATYIVFWVQDRKEESYIAVVGADYKGTGHFIYNNPPTFNVPEPLHVTNRNEATNWVVSQGALLASQDPEGKYIDLDLHDMELIKAGLCLWPKPPLEGAYNSYKIVGKELSGDGAEAGPESFMIILEETGTENTCIAVASSTGEDGSLVLNAAEQFGGMRLESKEEAEEWVKFILGQSLGPDGPLKLSSILRFQSAKGEKLPLPELPFSAARGGSSDSQDGQNKAAVKYDESQGCWNKREVQKLRALRGPWPRRPELPNETRRASGHAPARPCWRRSLCPARQSGCQAHARGLCGLRTSAGAPGVLHGNSRHESGGDGQRLCKGFIRIR